MDERTIIPTASLTLDTLCPEMASWPERWKVEDSDVALGQRITEALQPFLRDLIQHGLADKTLARHRDHLEMLGGEIIRRRYDDPDLAKQAIGELLFRSVEEDGGPLIWPRITETAQRAFDATCRKLYRFLHQQGRPK